jgi:hypothetical protein
MFVTKNFRACPDKEQKNRFASCFFTPLLYDLSYEDYSLKSRNFILIRTIMLEVCNVCDKEFSGMPRLRNKKNGVMVMSSKLVGMSGCTASSGDQTRVPPRPQPNSMLLCH